VKVAGVKNALAYCTVVLIVVLKSFVASASEFIKISCRLWDFMSFSVFAPQPTMEKKFDLKRIFFVKILLKNVFGILKKPILCLFSVKNIVNDLGYSYTIIILVSIIHICFQANILYPLSRLKRLCFSFN
jgi:hypothetical protein